MNTLKDIVKARFKGRLNSDVYSKYITMAEFIDSKGAVAWTWEPVEANLNFELEEMRFTNPKLQPTLPDWTLFLNDGFIGDVLLDFVIKSKSSTVRKIVQSLGTQGTKLTPSDMKALDALQALIKKGESGDNNIMYVQHNNPVRYDMDVKQTKELFAKYVIEDKNE